MSSHAGNLFPSGLWKNGCFTTGGNEGFTGWSAYTADSYSGSSCVAMNTNRFGSNIYGDDYIEVDPQNEYYQMSLMVKTYSRSYNNRLGSGHIGFACYDAAKNFITHSQGFSRYNTTLSSDLNINDTTMYVENASAWGTGAGNRSINFYPADSIYTTVGGYTRYQIYLPTGVTPTSSPTGVWDVPISGGSPYALPAGTPVGRSYDGGTFQYALGAPDYPEAWTNYTSTVMHGWKKDVGISGADFRWGTKYIRFLNLANYNYRSESSGNSARYLFDNICFVKLNGNAALPASYFQRTNLLKS